MNLKMVFAVTALYFASVAAAERPDLTGKVVEPDGSAVANASVFIYTAGPRVGPGYI
jgi:hypothetical protein